MKVGKIIAAQKTQKLVFLRRALQIDMLDQEVALRVISDQEDIEHMMAYSYKTRAYPYKDIVQPI